MVMSIGKKEFKSIYEDVIQGKKIAYGIGIGL